VYPNTSWVIPLLALALAASPIEAQDAGARQAYFRAVAGYFHLPPAEIAILGDWEIPPDDIPVVLFIAARAGVSPEALVALRGSGASWADLTRRYQINASQLHVPFSRPPSSGTLAAAYEQYGDRPVGQWGQISLGDEEIVALVNVRVLSTVLGMRPETVLERRATARSFVDLYARMIG